MKNDWMQYLSDYLTIRKLRLAVTMMQRGLLYYLFNCLRLYGPHNTCSFCLQNCNWSCVVRRKVIFGYICYIYLLHLRMKTELKWVWILDLCSSGGQNLINNNVDLCLLDIYKYRQLFAIFTVGYHLYKVMKCSMLSLQLVVQTLSDQKKLSLF